MSSPPLARVRLSCCRETVLLVIWALRGWRCSPRSGQWALFSDVKGAALAPAPRALSGWAEVLAPGLGRCAAAGPLLPAMAAVTSWSAFWQHSACVACLSARHEWRGCEPNARGMDTEDLAQHTAHATEGWKETVAGCNSIQYVWSFCSGVGGERPAKGPGQCPVFISVWRRSDSIGSVSFMLSLFPHLLSPYCMLACHSVRLWGHNDELRDCPLVLPLSWRSQSV